MEFFFLVIACSAAIDFALKALRNDYSLESSLTKLCATFALAIYVWIIEAPSLIIIALGFGLLTDMAIDSRKAYSLVAAGVCMVAANIAYIVLYLPYLNGLDAQSGITILIGAAYVITLIMIMWQQSGGLRLLGIATSLPTSVHFMVGLSLRPEFVFASYGAALLFISGALVACDQALQRTNLNVRRYANPLSWASYFSANVLIIAAFKPIF